MRRVPSQPPMRTPEFLRARLAAPIAHALLLVVVTLGTWLPLGFAGMPIVWDPAYFTYMAQAIARGEPIYAHTMMGYPPLGPLIAAGPMIVARSFDVPAYLAPRALAVALGVGSVLLVYSVARRATGAAWAGLVAGLCLAGFHALARSSLATLEPKHLVIFFGLVGAAATQRRRWGLAGCAAAMAFTSYLPAIAFGVAFGAVAARDGGRRAARNLLAYAAGASVGALPALVYLAATAAWEDFWMQAVVLPAAARVPTEGAHPLHWLRVIAVWYRSELPIFVAAAIGWAWCAAESPLRGARAFLDTWLGTRMAGMPLLAALEFQGYPDVYPLLPVAAFWAAWLLHRLTRLAARPGVAAAHGARSLGPWIGSFWVLLAAWVAFRDVPHHPPARDLPRQVAQARRIAGPPGATVVALDAEEIYVLTERRSPEPFLRLPPYFLPFLPRVGYRDCADVARSVVARLPRAFATRTRLSNTRCDSLIGEALVRHGYQREEARFGLLVYWRDGIPERPRG